MARRTMQRASQDTGWLGHSEGDMEVRHGQEVRLAVVKPLRAGERLALRTVLITT